MAPRNHPPDGQHDFFRKRTEDIAHENHPLVVLANKFNWSVFEESFGSRFHPHIGRPGLSTRLMVGLHYLKHAYCLSGETVLFRFAVEAVIGHLKSDCHMGRNFLLGEEGDKMNALLCGTGYNMRKLMREGCDVSFIFFFQRLCRLCRLFVSVCFLPQVHGPHGEPQFA